MYVGCLKVYDQTLKNPDIPQFIVVDTDSLELAGYPLLAKALNNELDVVTTGYFNDGNNLEELLARHEVFLPCGIEHYVYIYIDPCDPLANVIDLLVTPDSDTYVYKGKEVSDDCYM